MSVQFEGASELVEKLNAVDAHVLGDLATEVLEPAAAELESLLKNAAPKATGKLARSIKRAHRSYRGGELQYFYVGPTWPLGAHGQLVEEGTEDRYTADGLYRGKMPAEPFVEPTLKSSASSLADRIARDAAASIQEAAS